ncbi:MAG TPA: DUF814 domain-containing protein [Chloroflexi bacterium]|nr:DUF814 domain-containing protein [Chloroflexota bacterium]
MGERERIKAVALFSGGLDSTLAVRVMMEQGIAVTALHLRTSFSYVERNRLLGGDPVEPTGVERSAAALGVPLHVMDVFEAYLPLVLNPRYGYGSGVNPCVDCRIFLLRQAKQWMEEHDHHFVVTGEVVGQRPKSQMRPTLRTVERESGLRGYLFRPLSAWLLPPTIPEQRGWVDREALYGISGRGRKEQIALAERWGITEYAQPSGGCCYLIDQVYARRWRDFLSHEGPQALTRQQVQLMAVGRHLRLPSGRKVVVGRHERENEYLAACEVEGVWLTTCDHPGPTTVVMGTPIGEEIEQAARITAGYSDGRREPVVHVKVQSAAGATELLAVEPMPRERARALMV